MKEKVVLAYSGDKKRNRTLDDKSKKCYLQKKVSACQPG